MPQKTIMIFKEKYPYIRVGTLVSLHITCVFFVQGQHFRIRNMTHNDIKFGKEVKMITVVDKWLHSLARVYSTIITKWKIS